MSRSRRVFRLGLFSFWRMCAKPVRQMCAKSAENRPSDSPRVNGKDPARTGHGTAAGLSIAPLGPFATLGNPSGARPSATPRAFGHGYPSATHGARLYPPARLPPRPSPRTAARACKSPQAKGGPPHGTARPSALDIPLCARPFATRFARPFARPFATRGNPSGARPSATPRALCLGYPLATLGARHCPPARLPLAPSPRTAAGAPTPPQAKGGPPHGTARPSALGIPLYARPRRKTRAPAPRRRHR